MGKSDPPLGLLWWFLGQSRDGLFERADVGMQGVLLGLAVPLGQRGGNLTLDVGGCGQVAFHGLLSPGVGLGGRTVAAH